MNYKIVFLAIILIIGTFQTGFSQKKNKKKDKIVSNATSQNTTNTMDSISYAFGIVLGNNLKQQKIDDLNLDDLSKGIEAVINGTATMDNRTATQLVNDHMTKAQMSKGLAYLAENKKRPEVKTLPSGLQYEVLKEGTGAKPVSTDKVTTHYHGTLLDGTVFDSSVNRGEPASFPVNGVIQGWQEALVLMPVGSKWRLYVPSDLAYGARGAGGSIGPHETLIFDVELLKIGE